MKNFLGLFLVLVVGSALGVLISFLDLVYHAFDRARLSEVSATEREGGGGRGEK